MATPLLQTKLYIPPPRPDQVPRPRLIEWLNAGLHRKLTLVSAPAGFGKTTLLSEWIAGCGQLEPKVRVAWLSLDSILLSLFMTLLAFAVSCCKPGAATPTEKPTAASTATPTEEPLPEGPSLGDAITRPSDGMVMIYVPAGEFEIGTTDIPLEQPAHTVALDSFWIDRTEVSIVQFQRCVEAGGCDEPSCWKDGDLIWDNSDFNEPEQPVVCVNWHQARAYCEWAGGRLPTEAEWEYTARGPEGLEYPWGNEFDGTKLNYCDINCPKNYADESFDDGYAYTALVGSYPDGASWCGALDMAGNVREWAEDWFGEYPSGRQVNPTGPSSGIQRVMRGGAWEGLLFDTRNTVRKGGRQNFELLYLGFRCASFVSP